MCFFLMASLLYLNMTGKIILSVLKKNMLFMGMKPSFECVNSSSVKIWTSPIVYAYLRN